MTVDVATSTSELLFAQPVELAPWVEAVWYSAGPLERLRERVLPSASTDIVANLGDPMALCADGGRRRIVGTTVTGLMTRPFVLGHPPIHEAVGIRLSAQGLRAVLGVPTAAFTDQVVELDAVLDSAVDELAQACCRVASPRERLAAAVIWLRARLARVDDHPDPLAQWTGRRIEAARGSLSIRELQRRSGYGPTYFTRRFRDQLGVTPKRYARLVRFRAALDRLKPGVALADLALELGFTDQAHMNRDFQELAGCPPSTVLRDRYVSGLTIAES